MPDVVLRTRATILVTVRDGKAVTRVTILPDLGDAGNFTAELSPHAYVNADDIDAAIRFADLNEWAPLVGLPDDVVWEG